MKWRTINKRPESNIAMHVLLAHFEDDFLVSTTIGWWYPVEGFVPNLDREITHWMPYSEYWEAMQRLERI